MNKFFRIFLVCFFSLACIPELRSEMKEIKLMYFNVPPFIIVNESTGNVSGATYDFIENYMSKELGIKFVWDKSATAVPRQIENLKTSTDCASALLVYSDERSKSASFTATPYVDTRSAIAVLKTNKLDRINSVEDIVNMKIGYGQGVFITPFMSDKRIKFDFVSSANFAEVSLKKLLGNRVDGAYSPNNIQFLYTIKILSIGDKVKLINLPEKQTLNYFVFSKNSGDLVNKYNAAAAKLDIKNLYKKILSKYVDISRL